MAITMQQLSMEMFRLPPEAKRRLFNRLSFHLASVGSPDPDTGDVEYWTRLVMDRETTKLIEPLQPETLNVLEISGTAWGERESFASYKSVHYPEFDVCQGALDERFDLIIAEQVFEHLLWPYRAARNVLSMLKPGGHFLVTTPFMIKLHVGPHDCTRWSEIGLKNFLIESGFSESGVHTGSWGNRACAIANFYKQWVEYNPFIHSLANEVDMPVTVWALAQRPEEH